MKRMTHFQPFTIVLIILSLSWLTVTVGAAPPKQGPSSPSGQGQAKEQEFILHIAPDANFKAVVQALHGLQAQGQLVDVKPLTNRQVQVQAQASILSTLTKIPGITQALPLQREDSGQQNQVQQTEQIFWLTLDRNQGLMRTHSAEQTWPALLSKLTRLQAQGQIIRFQAHPAEQAVEVLVQSRLESVLDALPGVLISQTAPSPRPRTTQARGLDGQSSDESSRDEGNRNEGSGAISGLVTDEETNEPLMDIAVCVFPWFDYEYCATTDDEGQYTISGLFAADYEVVYFRDPAQRYIGEYYNNQTNYYSATLVAVTDEQTTTDINAALALGGRITGLVTDEAGNPLAGIRVDILTKKGNRWSWVGWAKTDEAGHYDAGGLLDGLYRIHFNRIHFIPSDYYMPWYQQGEFTQTKYVDEYYDDAATLEEAADIEVTLGQATSGIDATLTEGGTISGQVLDEDGNVWPYVNIEVYQLLDGEWVYRTDGYTDELGNYEIGNLRAGTYRVAFYVHFGWSYRQPFLQYYDQVDTLEEATDIVVETSQTVTEINATFVNDTGTIHGRVTNAAGDPLPNISVQTYLDSDDDSWWGGYQSGWAETDENGEYTLPYLVSGTHRIEFYDRSGLYLSEDYDNVQRFEDATRVQVSAGERSEVNVVLEEGGTIAGTVTRHSDGSALSYVSVCVYAQEPQQGESGDGTAGDIDSITKDWGACAKTDEHGHYQVKGLHTGAYLVEFQAYGQSYLGEYYDDKQSWDETDLVSVSAGQTTANIDAVLSNGGSISGLVTAEDKGTPLAYVWVCASPVDFRTDFDGIIQQQCAESDENGMYMVQGLPSDLYIVEFWAPYGSYINEFYDNQSFWGEATPVSVTVDETTANINAALSTSGHIQGTVTDEAGQPLPHIAVEVFVGEDFGWRSYTLTDENGHYDVSGLSKGSYYLGFLDRAGQYSVEYYDDMADLSQAISVTIQAGSTISNIDAILSQSGGITGYVQNEVGDPVSWVDVEVYQQIEGTWQTVGWGYADETGHYKVYGLGDGAHRVRFVDWNSRYYIYADMEVDPAADGTVEFAAYAEEYYDDASNLDSATDVFVTYGETTPNINAILSEGGHIIGTVTDAQGEPLPYVDVEVYRQQDGEWLWVNLGRTDETGQYHIAGLASGTYRLSFFWDEIYRYEYYQDASDVESATDVVVTVGETRANINISLDEVVRSQLFQ